MVRMGGERELEWGSWALDESWVRKGRGFVRLDLDRTSSLNTHARYSLLVRPCSLVRFSFLGNFARFLELFELLRPPDVISKSFQGLFLEVVGATEFLEENGMTQSH